MKDIEKLKIEQQELKERLLKLTDFINSEEYYRISNAERNLLNQQRTGMEIYLNALTRRICGDEESLGFGASSAMLPLLMTLLAPPAISAPIIGQPESDKAISSETESKNNI